MNPNYNPNPYYSNSNQPPPYLKENTNFDQKGYFGVNSSPQNQGYGQPYQNSYQNLNANQPQHGYPSNQAYPMPSQSWSSFSSSNGKTVSSGGYTTYGPNGPVTHTWSSEDNKQKRKEKEKKKKNEEEQASSDEEDQKFDMGKKKEKVVVGQPVMPNMWNGPGYGMQPMQPIMPPMQFQSQRQMSRNNDIFDNARNFINGLF